MRNEHVQKILRLAGMGLLLWVVPSAASLGLYDRYGKLTVSLGLFRSLIMVGFSVMSFGAIDPLAEVVAGRIFNRHNLLLHPELLKILKS